MFPLDTVLVQLAVVSRRIAWRCVRIVLNRLEKVSLHSARYAADVFQFVSMNEGCGALCAFAFAAAVEMVSEQETALSSAFVEFDSVHPCYDVE